MSKLSSFYPIQTGANNEILRKKSIEITDIDDEIIEFANVLLELMYEYDGVGLAAPQIGKNIRMVATTTWKTGKKGQELVSENILINPVITDASQEMVTSEEACLSLPNIVGNVKRHKTITVEYKDINGLKKRKKLKNYNAFIVQHEIDHLDGILFIDKLIPDIGTKKNKFK